MKIFFIAPFSGKAVFQKEYDRIISIIESTGSEVMSPEKTREYTDIFRQENAEKFGDKKAIHYEFIRSGVIHADAVVVEASHEDFRVGHEMTLALLYKKPVLCLSKSTDYSTLIRHEGFLAARYDDSSIQKVLLAFIQSVSKKSSLFRDSTFTISKKRLATIQDRKKTVAILGSINVDLLTKVASIPKENDVVISDGLQLHLGGKASNAAVALSRLEDTVYMIGKIGNDSFGSSVKSVFDTENIHTDYIDSDAFVPTGTVMVNVDSKGKNTIIVNEDANIRINNKSISDLLQKVDKKEITIDCFYTTLEPLSETVVFAINEFVKRKIPVFCDAAPVARPLPTALYYLVDFLAPNEFEASLMTGIDVKDTESAQKAALVLRSQGAQTVIITLSEKGAIVLEKGKEQVRYYPAFSVGVVDETAAGDAFRAAFVSEFLASQDLDASMKFATQAGAFAVTRLGSFNSMPTRDELSFF